MHRSCRYQSCENYISLCVEYTSYHTGNTYVSTIFFDMLIEGSAIDTFEGEGIASYL